MDTWLQQICSEDTTNIQAFAESRVGGRSENQDSYGWANTKFGYLVTVCDGMGGGPGGKTASSIAVKEIIDGVNEGLEDSTPGNVIIKAIQRANLAIIAKTEIEPQLKGMGSTATVLLITDDSAWVAHVGDSRVYQLRAGKKVFRTFDHSMVFEMVKKGVITEEQARLSAQSNIITRALGIKSDVTVDIIELPYLKGDRFVLTSDGIHGTMPEPELIMRCEKSNSAVGAIVDDIATYVDNLGKGLGNSHDNLTLAIIETKSNSKLKPKMTKQIKILIACIFGLLLVSVGINISQSCSMSGLDSARDSLNILKLQEMDRTRNIDSLKNANDSLKTKLDSARIKQIGNS